MLLASAPARETSAQGWPDHIRFADDWTAIRDSGVSVILEERLAAKLEHAAKPLLMLDPFMWRGRGAPHDAVVALGDLPDALARDIDQLATRFAELMNCGEVRLRLELVDNDSCRKLHADYTDLRLITTYVGRGTQFAPSNQADTDNLLNIGAGDIALVKGWMFAEGHEPCLHRSPPIAGTGERRLLLAIDTPRIDPENRR